MNISGSFNQIRDLASVGTSAPNVADTVKSAGKLANSIRKTALSTVQGGVKQGGSALGTGRARATSTASTVSAPVQKRVRSASAGLAGRVPESIKKGGQENINKAKADGVAVAKNLSRASKRFSISRPSSESGGSRATPLGSSASKNLSAVSEKAFDDLPLKQQIDLKVRASANEIRKAKMGISSELMFDTKDVKLDGKIFNEVTFNSEFTNKPEFKRLSDMTNNVSFNVSSDILDSESSKIAQKKLEAYIDVAVKLVEEGDLQSADALYMGLSAISANISSGKRKSFDLNEKAQTKMENLNTLFDVVGQNKVLKEFAQEKGIAEPFRLISSRASLGHEENLLKINSLKGDEKKFQKSMLSLGLKNEINKKLNAGSDSNKNTINNSLYDSVKLPEDQKLSRNVDRTANDDDSAVIFEKLQEARERWK